MLFCFPNTTFVHLVTVHFSASGKGATGIEIIRFAVNLKPLSGYHQTFHGEIIGFFHITAANVQPADQYCVAGLETPVIAVFDPAFGDKSVLLP